MDVVNQVSGGRTEQPASIIINVPNLWKWRDDSSKNETPFSIWHTGNNKQFHGVVMCLGLQKQTCRQSLAEDVCSRSTLETGVGRMQDWVEREAEMWCRQDEASVNLARSSGVETTIRACWYPAEIVGPLHPQMWAAQGRLRAGARSYLYLALVKELWEGGNHVFCNWGWPCKSWRRLVGDLTSCSQAASQSVCEDLGNAILCLSWCMCVHVSVCVCKCVYAGKIQPLVIVDR